MRVNNKALSLIILIFLILITAMLAKNGGVAWMALPFMAYLTIGLVQFPSMDQIQLEALRTLEYRQIGAEFSIAVNIRLSNRGKNLAFLTLLDPLETEIKILEGQTRQIYCLKSGEEVEMKYSFRADRGQYCWKTIQAVISDPLGLIGTTLELPAPAEIQVRPELQRFRPFIIRPQSTLHSTGSIPARFGGSGTNFWGIREYQPGDPLRRLDWRLTARHPHKFFTKEFEQEEIADIGIILDARSKTDLRVNDDHLFEHSIQATASLAEMFLRQGNRVSLLVYGKSVVNLYPGYGKIQLNRILQTLAKAGTDDQNVGSSLQFIPLNSFSRHSLLIVISPLATNDWHLFPRLRALGFQALLISPDPVNFVQDVLPNDPTTQLAVRLTGLERTLEIHKIKQLWIPVVNWQVNQPLASLVRNAMRHVHIQHQR
jgi:uncharacterized protein (DUF58 family)